MAEFVTLNHDIYHRGDIIDYCMEDMVHSKVIFPYIREHNLNACGNFKVLIKTIKVAEIVNLLEGTASVAARWENRILVAGKGKTKFIGEVMIKSALNSLQVSIDFWANDLDMDAVLEVFKKTFKDFETGVKNAIVMDVNWYYMKEEGVNESGIQELIYEKIHPEAYPYLDLDKFVDGYFKSSSSVLIICGIPGTGKTKLIRHLIRRAVETGAEFVNKFKLKHRYHGEDDDYGPEIARNEKDDDTARAKVAYTMDMGVMSNDDFYLRMRTNNYQFVVLEDIDFKLGSRSEGNDVMHKFLAASDGFVTSNYKVIMTTNLSVTDIDPALLRPGRCYASIETRRLSYQESIALAKKLNKGLSLENREHSLAEIYGLAYNLSYEKNPVVPKVGFGKK